MKEDTEELDLDVDVDVATKDFLIIFAHLDWNIFSQKHFGSAVDPNPDLYLDPDSMVYRTRILIGIRINNPDRDPGGQKLIIKIGKKLIHLIV